MSATLTLELAAITDPGPRYRINQDALLACDQVLQGKLALTQTCRNGKLLLAVADGSAINPCPAQASKKVLELLLAQNRAGRPLTSQGVRELQCQFSNGAVGTRCEGMSSTLAALSFEAGNATLLHVGDSRIYLYRDGALQQMTEDHTVRRRMLRDGDLSPAEARQAGSLYDDLDSALVASDLEDGFDVDVSRCATHAGDIWLCCTDGLTARLDNPVIAKLLSLHSGHAPATLAAILLDHALRTSGHDDNVSLIVTSVSATPA